MAAEHFEPLGDLLSEITKFAALLVFGALITPDRLSHLTVGGWILAVVTIVLVRPAAMMLSLLRTPMTRRERSAAAWFGPKGFASVVYGLLALQSGIPDNELVFDLVAVTIALSIVLHSSTDVPVAKALSFEPNTTWSGAYEALREVRVGPAALHLDLSLATWAADGLLAIFFVAGLEVKRELVAGDLRDPRRAAVPVAAAVGGVVVPALIYIAINVGDSGALSGWAIPTATDIAFALAVLAVIGHHLPSALRTFLLTLAVVDDLIAIVIIAVFYTRELLVGPLLLALLPLAVFAVLVQRRVRSWWLLLPLAAATWALVHASGIHATVAGVLLGFAVPVIRKHGEGPGLAEHFEHRFRPISAAVVVPVFAFFAAGVTVGGLGGLADSLLDPVALGIVVALVLGKTVGITGATYLVARFTRAELHDDLAWTDVIGLAALGGIGFTVSLLIGDLAFGAGSESDEKAKIAILVCSLLAGLVATIILRIRNRVHRRICAEESVDSDHDGIPDVHQHEGER